MGREEKSFGVGDFFQGGCVNLELIKVNKIHWCARILQLDLCVSARTKREAFVKLGSAMKRVKKKDLEGLV